MFIYISNWKVKLKVKSWIIIVETFQILVCLKIRWIKIYSGGLWFPNAWPQDKAQVFQELVLTATGG